MSVGLGVVIKSCVELYVSSQPGHIVILCESREIPPPAMNQQKLIRCSKLTQTELRM